MTARRIEFVEWLKLAWTYDEQMRLLMINMAALMFAAFMLAFYAELWILPLGLSGTFMLVLLWRWCQDVKHAVWFLQEVKINE